MTWDDFYNRFYDWAESTQVSRISQIENFGDSDEVTEIANEYAYIGTKEVTRFIKRALSMGVKFSAENIRELIYNVDETIIFDLAKSHSTPFSQDDLDELYTYLNDKQLKQLAKSSKITYVSPNEPDEIPQQKKPGFFAMLFGLAGMSQEFKSTPHNGRCNGDCANCPPHYGYRYGRWYYGHDHIEGCEFGGNKGGGGL